MNLCDKCKQKNNKKLNKCECNYKEIHMLLNYIDDDLGKQFEIYDCPDENPNTDYTCDFVFKERNTSEKMYVEVKTVLYGFDNPEDEKKETAGKKRKSLGETIAQNNDQMFCMQLVSNVVDCCDEEKMDFLWDFAVTIPQLQIGVEECEEFCRQLKLFLDKTSFEEDEYCFIYKRKRRGEEIKIPFTRKSDELREMFDENIAFLCDVSGDGHLPAIFGRMSDVKNLKELLKQDARKTSEKNKFPETEERKVLLNILRLPHGFELFFDLIINTVIEGLINDLDDYESTADESYLLYYSPDYNEIKVKEDDSYERKPFGETLFIIPLIEGLVKDVIVYGGSDN